MRRSPAVTPAVDVVPADGGRRWRRGRTEPSTASASPSAVAIAVEAPPLASAGTGETTEQAARAALSELSAPIPPPTPAASAPPAVGFNGRLAPDSRPASEQQQSPERRIVGLLHELRTLSAELDAVRQRAAADRDRLLAELDSAQRARADAEAELAVARHAARSAGQLPAPRSAVDELARP